ncbi:unnamed protein product, partial [Phaeothamnion confervicola]
SAGPTRAVLQKHARHTTAAAVLAHFQRHALRQKMAAPQDEEKTEPAVTVGRPKWPTAALLLSWRSVPTDSADFRQEEPAVRLTAENEPVMVASAAPGADTGATMTAPAAIATATTAGMAEPAAAPIATATECKDSCQSLRVDAFSDQRRPLRFAVVWRVKVTTLSLGALEATLAGGREKELLHAGRYGRGTLPARCQYAVQPWTRPTGGIVLRARWRLWLPCGNDNSGAGDPCGSGGFSDGCRRYGADGRGSDAARNDLPKREPSRISAVEIAGVSAAAFLARLRQESADCLPPPLPLPLPPPMEPSTDLEAEDKALSQRPVAGWERRAVTVACRLLSTAAATALAPDALRLTKEDGLTAELSAVFAPTPVGGVRLLFVERCALACGADGLRTQPGAATATVAATAQMAVTGADAEAETATAAAMMAFDSACAPTTALKVLRQLAAGPSRAFGGIGPRRTATAPARRTAESVFGGRRPGAGPASAPARRRQYSPDPRPFICPGCSRPHGWLDRQCSAAGTMGADGGEHVTTLGSVAEGYRLCTVDGARRRRRRSRANDDGNGNGDGDGNGDGNGLGGSGGDKEGDEKSDASGSSRGVGSSSKLPEVERRREQAGCGHSPDCSASLSCDEAVLAAILCAHLPPWTAEQHRDRIAGNKAAIPALLATSTAATAAAPAVGPAAAAAAGDALDSARTTAAAAAVALCRHDPRLCFRAVRVCEGCLQVVQRVTARRLEAVRAKEEARAAAAKRTPAKTSDGACDGAGGACADDEPVVVKHRRRSVSATDRPIGAAPTPTQPAVARPVTAGASLGRYRRRQFLAPTVDDGDGGGWSDGGDGRDGEGKNASLEVRHPSKVDTRRHVHAPSQLRSSPAAGAARAASPARERHRHGRPRTASAAAWGGSPWKLVEAAVAAGPVAAVVTPNNKVAAAPCSAARASGEKRGGLMEKRVATPRQISCGGAGNGDGSAGGGDSRFPKATEAKAGAAVKAVAEPPLAKRTRLLWRAYGFVPASEAARHMNGKRLGIGADRESSSDKKASNVSSSAAAALAEAAVASAVAKVAALEMAALPEEMAVGAVAFEAALIETAAAEEMAAEVAIAEAATAEGAAGERAAAGERTATDAPAAEAAAAEAAMGEAPAEAAMAEPGEPSA